MERSVDPSEALTPTRIGRRDPARIVLEWRDGQVGDLPAAVVRRACPCARCVHEVTGERLLDPASIPDDLRHESVELVGRYALGIRFADGHQTGIFTWAYLRRIAEGLRGEPGA
ncbi:MAG: DUF971 domain-containing protein [Planctomycetota bacterium]